MGRSSLQQLHLQDRIERHQWDYETAQKWANKGSSEALAVKKGSKMGWKVVWGAVVKTEALLELCMWGTQGWDCRVKAGESIYRMV